MERLEIDGCLRIRDLARPAVGLRQFGEEGYVAAQPRLQEFVEPCTQSGRPGDNITQRDAQHGVEATPVACHRRNPCLAE